MTVHERPAVAPVNIDSDLVVEKYLGARIEGKEFSVLVQTEEGNVELIFPADALAHRVYFVLVDEPAQRPAVEEGPREPCPECDGRNGFHYSLCSFSDTTEEERAQLRAMHAAAARPLVQEDDKRGPETFVRYEGLEGAPSRVPTGAIHADPRDEDDDVARARAVLRSGNGRWEPTEWGRRYVMYPPTDEQLDAFQAAIERRRGVAVPQAEEETRVSERAKPDISVDVHSPDLHRAHVPKRLDHAVAKCECGHQQEDHAVSNGAPAGGCLATATCLCDEFRAVEPAHEGNDLLEAALAVLEELEGATWRAPFNAEREPLLERAREQLAAAVAKARAGVTIDREDAEWMNAPLGPPAVQAGGVAVPQADIETILRAIAQADNDDRVSEIKVDVPLGGYPRSYLRAAVEHVLSATGWHCATCGVGFDTARELAAHNCLATERAVQAGGVAVPQAGYSEEVQRLASAFASEQAYVGDDAEGWESAAIEGFYAGWDARGEHDV